MIVVYDNHRSYTKRQDGIPPPFFFFFWARERVNRGVAKGEGEQVLHPTWTPMRGWISQPWDHNMTQKSRVERLIDWATQVPLHFLFQTGYYTYLEIIFIKKILFPIIIIFTGWTNSLLHTWKEGSYNIHFNFNLFYVKLVKLKQYFLFCYTNSRTSESIWIVMTLLQIIEYLGGGTGNKDLNKKIW